MNKESIAITNSDNTCCNCLKEGKVHNIHIRALGYGSGFDNFSTQINLCDECYNLTNPEWWKLNVIDDEYDGHYEFESEILKFVNQMPLAGRELFHNRYAYGACADYKMEPQDYIDYELEILSHDKCKEYGYYSPNEIKAYQEKFPICEYPYKKVYNDGSFSCWCPFGAYGVRIKLAVLI